MTVARLTVSSMPPLSQLVTDLFAFTLQLLNREIKTNPLQPIFIHHSRLTESLRLETVVFPTVSQIIEGIDIILAAPPGKNALIASISELLQIYKKFLALY
jgi:hypothetical protein